VVGPPQPDSVTNAAQPRSKSDVRRTHERIMVHLGTSEQATLPSPEAILQANALFIYFFACGASRFGRSLEAWMKFGKEVARGLVELSCSGEQACQKNRVLRFGIRKDPLAVKAAHFGFRAVAVPRKAHARRSDSCGGVLAHSLGPPKPGE